MAPQLSVLITCGNRRERVANALASVLNQSLADQLEVILLECGDSDAPAVAGVEYPNVRRVYFPSGVTAGHVRAEGVRMARAPLVVFLEEHAAACPGWAESILRAFDEDKWAAVGAEILNGNPAFGISDALSLGYYPRYEHEGPRQEVEWLPLHNTAYRRDAVMKYDADLDILFALEILLQWRLGEDGCHLLWEPASKVVHYYETDVPTVWKHDVNAQRAFIVNRANLYAWPFWKRTARLLGLPLMPPVRVFKSFVTIIASRSDQLGRYFRGLPVMISAYLACATGEFLGLTAGASDGDARYLDYSVNAPRLLPADFPQFKLEVGSALSTAGKGS